MRTLIFFFTLALLASGCAQNWGAKSPLDPIGASSLPVKLASHSSRTVGFDGREKVHYSVHQQTVSTGTYINSKGAMVPVTVVTTSYYRGGYTNNIPSYYGSVGSVDDPKGVKGSRVEGIILLKPPGVRRAERFIEQKVKGK